MTSQVALIQEVRRASGLPMADPVVALAKLQRMADEGREIPTAATYALSVASTLRAWLPLSEPTAYAWTSSVLSQRPPLSQAPSPVASSEVYTEPEVAAAAREVAENLRKGEYPVIRDLIGVLRRKRTRIVEDVDQDLSRQAIAERSQHHPMDHRRTQVYAAVLQDVLDGRVKGEDFEEEASRRLAEVRCDG